MNEVHLSELEIDPADHLIFMLGEDIALLNSSGNVAPELRAENLMLDYESGRFQMRGAILDMPSLDRVAVEAQLRSARESFGEENWVALIAGYAHESYLLLDRIVPGFTDQILDEIITVPILSRPKPRDPELRMDRLLPLLGIDLDFSADKPRLVVGKCGQFDDKDHDAAVLTLATLAVAGIDLAPWLEANGGEDRDDACAGIARELAASATPAPEASETTAVDAAAEFVRDITERRGSPATSDGLPHAIAFEVLKPYAKKLEHPQLAILSGALSEGLRHIAALADAAGEGSRVFSMHMAQLSRIFLQGLAKRGLEMETRLGAANAGLDRLAWYQGGVDYANLGNGLVYASYVCSAATTELLSFGASIEAMSQNEHRSLLWSAVRKAHKRIRALVTVLYGLQVERELEERELQAVEAMMMNTLGRYRECLESQLQATRFLLSREVLDPMAELWGNMPSETNPGYVAARETFLVRELAERIENHGLQHEQTQYVFDMLLDTIYSVV